jgi:hypothetical protein
MERDILINAAHPDARVGSHELLELVWWNERLFG